jgi:hypothetical protein
VRLEVLTRVVTESSLSWDITPCSPLKAMLAACMMLVCCLAYPSKLKMEATYSCETSVDLEWTTLRYIL